MTAESVCRACGAPIIWAITPRGKRMPVDREPLEEGREVAKQVIRWRLVPFNGSLHATKGKWGEVASDLHLSHFNTCPKATEMSQKSKGREKAAG